MAPSHGMVTLGRFALILLLYLKLISICINVVSCIVLGHLTFTVGILLILSTVTLHIVGMISFGEAWTLGKRPYYSYTWFGYTCLLIVDIIVVLTPYLLVVDAEKDIPFWLTIFVKVLYITPFTLLLFLNTAGEEGTEFHGESRWLFATMSAQIFDAIDMIDNVLNGYGNGPPTGLGVGMITLAFGCLLLAAWEFLELAHHSPGSKNGAKVYRLIVLILVSLATLIIRAVVYVNYGWRETTPIAKNVIMICISVSELRRCFGQTSL